MVESVPAAMPVVPVVDDDEDIRSLVASRSESSGFPGLQALEGSRRSRLRAGTMRRCLPLDVIMPNLDGRLSQSAWILR